MNKRSSFSIVLLLSALATIFGQSTPAPTPSPQQPQQQGATAEDDEVVRITANLVQVDAVVVDGKGNQVTDLASEDFEILEDDRPQKITNFSYVSTESARPTAAATPSPRDRNAPPVPPVRLRPEQVRRTMALVVDDLGLSFESAHFVRRTLRKFVDEQMQPADLVAIIRTGGGMGALQQFTSDKRQLYAAIERVRWNPQGRAGISAFATIGRDTDERGDDDSATSMPRSSNDLGNEMDQFREELFTVGTLGALNYIVRGLRELPGRKSVLLITDGFNIFSTPRAMAMNRVDVSRLDSGRNDRVFESLRRLTDLANRASVVIYTLDARGIQPLGLTAQDDVSDFSPDQLRAAESGRRNEFLESQSGPIYLARETGGFSIRNSNDLSGGIRRVLDDQKGYYLIGYRPAESTFDPKSGSRRFHNIKVKVKRAGLRVRSRNGFYGVVNDEARAVPRTRVAQLNSALVSPFNSNAIRLRLTSLFGNDPKAGSFVRSLLHVDGRDVTFTKEPDGWNKAVLDVLVITFGDNGTVVDQITNTYTVQVRGRTYERALKDGFIYTINLPVKKGGAYQLRAALRDASSERVGSASQFIEVPDINKNRLVLSGIVVSGIDPKAAATAATGGGNPAAAATTTANTRATTNTTTAAAAAPASASSAAPGGDAAAQGTAEESAGGTETEATPAIRRFRRGMVLQYDYVVFNARLDKTTSRPQLQTQLRLFRDGEPVFTGTLKPLETGNQADLKRLITGGALRLGADMTPGEYVLQVIVKDALAEARYGTATQWIDFEIVQ
ncbi:MAG TPA: VWA domain-containing protein [Pyrinomonadaceae bacterium]|jgi:VWFA-related protein|nr:VWA domain-containing protein [Pyrinomonadaceae bacterium]